MKVGLPLVKKEHKACEEKVSNCIATIKHYLMSYKHNKVLIKISFAWKLYLNNTGYARELHVLLFKSVMFEFCAIPEFYPPTFSRKFRPVYMIIKTKTNLQKSGFSWHV